MKISIFGDSILFNISELSIKYLIVEILVDIASELSSKFDFLVISDLFRESLSSLLYYDQLNFLFITINDTFYKNNFLFIMLDI
jgi:hypothetical protein